jgi:hypothetical protein
MDSSLLNKGIYQFTIAKPPAPAFKVNDVIVGMTAGGYIVKITAVNFQNNIISLSTSQATMQDAFEDTSFTISTPFDSNLNANTAFVPLKTLENRGRTITTGMPLGGASSNSGYTFDLTGQTLFQNNLINLQVTSGSITINGDWFFGFYFDNWQLTQFNMTCSNCSLESDLNMGVTVNGSINIPPQNSVLARVAKYNTFLIGEIPVVLYTEVELRDSFSASISSAIQGSVNLISTDNTEIGVIYQNAQWQNVFLHNHTGSLTASLGGGTVSSQIQLSLVPYVSFRLYRILGPYASLGLKELVKGDVASPSLDWDFYAGAWVQTVAGLQANILGTSIFNYSTNWSTDTLFYQTPYQIHGVSGNNQYVGANSLAPTDLTLPAPIRVQVLDNNNRGQSRVPVYFRVAAGTGKVQDSIVLTDTSGYASTEWTLGMESGTQTVNSLARDANGTFIQNAPVSFSAVNYFPALNIGDTAFGGIIFYIDSTGKHGLVCATQDQTSASVGIQWDPTPYNGNLQNYPDTSYHPTITGAIDTSIGSGAKNTNLIVNKLGPGNYAAYLCKSLSLNGFSDWYLPSWDELLLMYQNLAYRYEFGQSGYIPWRNFGFITTFQPTGTDSVNYSYWSSTEYNGCEKVDLANQCPGPYDGLNAWDRPFDYENGPAGSGSAKYQYRSVRAVRAF